jgi:heme-degrading monooxygenase HmoA
MSVKVLLSLEVEDFNKMKSVFDAAENARTEAGITAEAYRNMDVPNNVWVISTASSKEAFSAFFSSPAQKERMRNAGVISPPTITFLE